MLTKIKVFLNKPLPPAACWAFGKEAPCKVCWFYVILLVILLTALTLSAQLNGRARPLNPSTRVRFLLWTPNIMKLITRPERTVTWHDVAMYGAGSFRTAGRASVTYAEISHNDFDKQIDEVWDRLKYGVQIKLELGEKIDRLEFPEDGITMYGVIPIEIMQTSFEEGCIYKCQVDYFEES